MTLLIKKLSNRGRASRPVGPGRQHPPAARRPSIAIVSDAVYPYHQGGKELRYYELGQRLSEEAAVHIYTMHWWDGPKVMQLDGVTLHAICPLVPMYKNGRRSILQAVIFACCCLRLLAQRFDVIEADHIPFFQLFTLKIVSVLRRRRLIATWHEVWGAAYWRRYLGFHGIAASIIENLAMRLPDCIVAASPQTAARLESILGSRSKIVVAPNGINLDIVSKAQVSSDHVHISFVGRHLEHKRIDMLIEAVAALRERKQDVLCRIIGDGPETDALIMQAELLGVRDLISFRQDVRSQSELYGLLKASDIFVFPSEREGFGIAVLEAMACGLPVITTDAPDNLSQFVAARSARNVICEPTSASIANEIEKKLAADRKELAPDRSVESWISEYDWDHQAEVVMAVLLNRKVDNSTQRTIHTYSTNLIGGNR